MHDDKSRAHDLGTKGDNALEGIIGDLKSFTSRSIRKIIEAGTEVRERRTWMYDMMQAFADAFKQIS